MADKAPKLPRSFEYFLFVLCGADPRRRKQNKTHVTGSHFTKIFTGWLDICSVHFAFRSFNGLMEPLWSSKGFSTKCIQNKYHTTLIMTILLVILQGSRNIVGAAFSASFCRIKRKCLMSHPFPSLPLTDAP